MFRIEHGFFILRCDHFDPEIQRKSRFSLADFLRSVKQSILRILVGLHSNVSIYLCEAEISIHQ